MGLYVQTKFHLELSSVKKGKDMIPAQRVVRIKGETMDVIVHRNKCAGVRACAQTGCSTSYPIAYAS